MAVVLSEIAQDIEPAGLVVDRGTESLGSYPPLIGFPFGRCWIVSLVIRAADNFAEDVRRCALARDGALLRKAELVAAIV